MSLRDEIISAQKNALKEHDELLLSTTRMLWSSIRNQEIEKRTEGVETLNDSEVQEIVSKQIKQLNDALKDFEAGGRQDLVEKNKAEIEILKKYLPPQLSDEEILEVIHKIMAETGIKESKDSGRLMGMAVKELKGRADGIRIKNLVTSQLT